MKYGALMIAILVALVMLILFFQNLITSTDFYFLFTSFSISSSVALMLGFFSGVLITICLSLFFKEGGEGSSDF